eukprot:g2683.t1
MATGTASEDGDGASLLDELPQPNAKKVLSNFWWLCVTFSTNHAVVVTALSLATAELGPELGAYGSGTLYITYTFAALFLAPGVVGLFGPKRAMVAALYLYSVYVASFLAATIVHTRLSQPVVEWLCVIAGSIIGGCGAGWMWTAQGAYFAGAARAYASCLERSSTQPPTSGIRQRETASLAGVFGFIFLGIEVLVKMAVSIIMRTSDTRDASGSPATAPTGEDDDSQHGSATGVEIAFAAMLALALGAAAAMQLLLWERPGGPRASAGSAAPPSTRSAQASSLLSRRKLLLAVGLMRRRDGLVLLLAPFQVAFGLMSSLLLFYVNGTLAKAAVGASNIGFLTAVLASSAALCSPLFGGLVRRAWLSKHAALVVGLVAFLTEALLLLSLPQAELESAGWRDLCFVYVLHGVGRGVFESTNKALFADLFTRGTDVEAAFANVIVFSGGASAIAFFVFPRISPSAMAGVCVVFILLGALGVMQASRRRGRYAAGGTAFASETAAEESQESAGTRGNESA